jgi:hypothetical protein
MARLGNGSAERTQLEELIGALRHACASSMTEGSSLWLSLDEARVELERIMAAGQLPGFELRCAMARAEMILHVWRGSSARCAGRD